MIRRIALALALVGAAIIAPAPAEAATAVTFDSVIPAPVTSVAAPGVTFTITSASAIHADAGASPIADQLATILRRSTGYALPVVGTAADISLLLSGAPASVGTEGYQLDITASGINLRANALPGLFNGVQTLRQLLPVTADATTVQPGPWPIPGGPFRSRG